MIVILFAESQQGLTEGLVKTLTVAFRERVETISTKASKPEPWPVDIAWDDLLIVLFDGTPFPTEGNAYINAFLNARDGQGLLLPVCVGMASCHIPEGAKAIKAFPFDATSPSIIERLTQRVGAMLGQRVLHREAQVFISYRAIDGTALACQIEERLKELAYPVWRDEAKEIDGETKILPGTPVQKQIDDGLARAAIVLLLDTPQAPHSHWIKHEVDTANGLLVPILPVCFRSKTDPKRGPRFRSLQDLQRWIEIDISALQPNHSLGDDDLDRIIFAMEEYLCQLFQRKCRVPFLVEKEFASRDYSWKILDQRLLMCESTKAHSLRTKTKVLCHCSIFEQVHGPTMEMFGAFLKKTNRPNHALYIYDGELIPEPELQSIIESTSSEDGVVILHHQELAALIDSNFTTFSP